jgi:single-stranded DNA-binding protein
MGRLQQRTQTAGDGSARSAVEVVAEELGSSLRWATATTTRTTSSRPRAVASLDERSAGAERDGGAACQRSAPSLLILRVCLAHLIRDTP